MASETRLWILWNLLLKREYIPDGTGAWYRGKILEPYSECMNDDDLTIYFLKSL